MKCERVTDIFPDLVRGRLPDKVADDLRAHLEGCAECTSDLEVVRMLVDAPASPVPEGLEFRVLAAARDASRRMDRTAAAVNPGVSEGTESGTGRVFEFPRRVPSWALGMAAVLVLALGTPLLVDRMANSTDTDPAGSTVVDAEYVDDPVVTVWASEDGMIAGAPVIESLTDEELAMLLEEMDG